MRKQIFLARVSGEDKVAVVGGAVAVSSPSPILQKLDRQALWAGSGKADNNSDFSAIMCYALGAKCKIILGYKGTGGMNIAIQRGEVDGRVISDEAAALYGPSSGMRVVTVLARQRSEKFPDVPTIFEVGEAVDRGGAAARLARQHREPRPRDPGDARHAQGARRLSARGAGARSCRTRPSSPR